jgi:hypothetical protein
MFSHCNSLAELNAERIKLSATVPIVELNNAYNQRRQEVLNASTSFKRVHPITVIPEPVTKYAGIPIAGRSPVPGCIKLTEGGFLF